MFAMPTACGYSGSLFDLQFALIEEIGQTLAAQVFWRWRHSAYGVGLPSQLCNHLSHRPGIDPHGPGEHVRTWGKPGDGINRLRVGLTSSNVSTEALYFASTGFKKLVTFVNSAYVIGAWSKALDHYVSQVHLRRSSAVHPDQAIRPTQCQPKSHQRR